MYVHTGPCSYLPDRTWSLRMMLSPRSDAAYRELLETRHRRSGWVVYRPACAGCQACLPIRVPVATFRPSRSQRRSLARNRDVVVSSGPPEPTEEKLLLHNRFVTARFRRRADGGFASVEAYAEVFGASPVTTLEMCYRVGGRLVGVGVVDVLPDVVSSVYFYYDPDEGRRSLGVFSVLTELQLARDTARSYLYLGYFVAACREMRYKAAYRPCEVLHPDGAWRAFDEVVDGEVDPARPPATETAR